ncbi:hypothetical protein FRC09_017781, partial [Ceratobasidium sp. 395]
MPVYRISNDIRWTIVRLSGLRVPARVTAAVVDVCERSVQYVNKLFRTTGNVDPPPGILPMGRPRIYGNDAVEYLLQQITREPDMYLDEMEADLANTFGVDSSIRTVSRTLTRSGVTRKKLDRRATERCEFKRLEYRQQYHEVCLDPSYAVFVDESAVDRRTTYRNFGYALSGNRASRKAFRVRGKRYSLLPAIANDGILTLQVIPGS